VVEKLSQTCLFRLILPAGAHIIAVGCKSLAQKSMILETSYIVALAMTEMCISFVAGP
jgi:hypothetical protein